MKQFPKEHVEAVDNTTRNPHRRTIKVWMYLKKNEDISHWDIMCFATAYLLNTVVMYPFIKDAAMDMARKIKFFHYAYPETLDSKKDGLQLEPESVVEDAESIKTTFGQ
jgi:hypothetical protein